MYTLIRGGNLKKTFTINDFIKKYSGKIKIKLSQKQINYSRKEAWSNISCSESEI